MDSPKTKTSHISENLCPCCLFTAHPPSSPSTRHTTRPPGYPPEHPSPSKRPRHASTSSSSPSLPSTPSRDRNNVDFHQARFESTMRLKDSWAQLAQRYARPLEEDDIIDLREVTILKDRGVVRNLGAQANFGNVSLPDELGNDASSEAGGAPSEEDEEDFDEIDAFARSPVQKRLEAQLRRVKPLHDDDSEDEDDLREFLEAERRTREEFGPVDEDFGEQLAELQEQVSNEGGDLADEVIEVFDSSDEECEQPDMSRTFTNSTNVDCDSEDEDDDEGEYGDGDGADNNDDDELGGWERDESNAIYEVVRTPISEVIEIFDTPPSSPPSSPLTMSDPLSRSSSIFP